MGKTNPADQGEVIVVSPEECETTALNARIRLILKSPFFVDFLVATSMKIGEGVVSYALAHLDRSDNLKLYYKLFSVIATFLKKEKVEESKSSVIVHYIILHEMLHFCLLHLHRAELKQIEQEEAIIWNIAADLKVNDILLNSLKEYETQENENLVTTFFKETSMTKHAENISDILAKNYMSNLDSFTTEQIYEVLKQENKKSNSAFKKLMDSLKQMMESTEGTLFGDVMNIETNDVAVDKAKLKVQKLTENQNCSKMDAKLLRNLEKELKLGQVPWYVELRRYLTVKAQSNYSFSRPRRNMICHDLILPGEVKESSKLNCTIYIDTSGSMGDKELQILFGEIKNLSNLIGKCTLIFFHSEVYKVETIEANLFFGDIRKTIDKLSASLQSGGTYLSKAFQYAIDYKISSDISIILTDGYLGENDEELSIVRKTSLNSIWIIINGDFKTDLGRVVYVKGENYG